MIQTTLYSYLSCNSSLKNTSAPLSKNPIVKKKQTSIYDYFTKPIGIRTKNQRSILEYFNTNNNKNNSNKVIHDNKKKRKKKETFDITLIDISNTYMNKIRCVKENMYNESLKYIAISYRWGEVPKQYVKTPDYTAQVTSFSLSDLFELIFYIRKEPDLKEIPYIWIDAISMDQQNPYHLKSTLYHMSTIYKRATYLLAVPDLNLECLKINIANQLSIDIIMKNNQLIYDSLQRYFHHSSISKKKGMTKMLNSIYKITTSKDDLKLAYDFLQYLLDDWSHRTWVISEYQIAKNKNTPMKFIFIMLLHNLYSQKPFPFFSYSFCHSNTTSSSSSVSIAMAPKNKSSSSLSSSSTSSSKSHPFQLDQHHSIDYLIQPNSPPLSPPLLPPSSSSTPFSNNTNYTNNNNNNNTTTTTTYNNNNNTNIMATNKKHHEPSTKKLTYESKFIHSFEYILLQRHHLDMILNSNAAKNEDRFYAILPIWNKYQHLIKDKNVISHWHITDMISVRLKLYEFMDLWDKARLLKSCSSKFVRQLPSFASVYHSGDLELLELDDPKNANPIYYKYLKKNGHPLPQTTTVMKDKNIDMLKKNHHHHNKRMKNVDQMIEHQDVINNMQLYQMNLLSIQFIPPLQLQQLPILHLKSVLFYVCKSDHDVILPQPILNQLKLDINHLKKVIIPYFMYSIPSFMTLFPDQTPTAITLIGSFDENKWVLEYPHYTSLNDYKLIDHIDYTFCIY
ncbi:unnamed protein product [Cunninghamella blakesleeana]